MAKSTRIGMQTFDQDLFQLYENGEISYEEAIRNADSKNELRLRIKLESKRDKPVAADDSGGPQVVEEDGRCGSRRDTHERSSRSSA